MSDGQLGTDGAGAPGAQAHRLGAVFWIALVIGGAVMAFGVRGAVSDLGSQSSIELAKWVVGIDLVHDLLLAPVVVVVGLLLARVLPVPARGPVRSAVALSGLVVLFSVPLITAWGRHPGNSSTLPLDYAHSVFVVLTLIWILTALVIAVRIVRRA